MARLLGTRVLLNALVLALIVCITAVAAFPFNQRTIRREASTTDVSNGDIIIPNVPNIFSDIPTPFPNATKGVSNSTKCVEPKVRVEWRRLKDSDKKSWIDAVHCMHKSPSKYKKEFPATRNRYDDFVAFHVNATAWLPGTHNNGFFLPFHRYLMFIWENTLRDECGYQGPTPWWDWSLDTPERGGHFNSSPIWDATLGFGGDGKVVANNTEDSRCLVDGPWAQYNASMTWKPKEPGFERCVERDFDWRLGEASGSPREVLNGLLERDRYANFSELDFAPWGFDPMQGGPHTIGHMAVGGEMSNLFTSTNDPLFWIHHGGVDNFWWRWQGRNNTRLADIRRSVIDFHNEGEAVPEGRIFWVTRLTTPLFMVGEFAPVIPIRSVMDTINENGEGFLCYTYDSDSYS